MRKSVAALGFWMIVLLCAGGAHAADESIRYTDFAFGEGAVRWAHPGEHCDRGTVCFQLPGFKPTVEQVSTPTRESESLVLAQTQLSGAWILYDLRDARSLLETSSEERAFAEWAKRAHVAPQMVPATEAPNALVETGPSKLRRWTLEGMLWTLTVLPKIILVGPVLFFLMAAFTLWSNRNRGPLRYALATVFWVVPGMLLTSLAVRAHKIFSAEHAPTLLASTKTHADPSAN
jgi:hypothetical protein